MHRLNEIAEICTKFKIQPIQNLMRQELWDSECAQYAIQVNGVEAFIMIEPKLDGDNKTNALRTIRGIREDLNNLRAIYKERGTKSVAYLDMDGANDDVARFWKLIGAAAPSRVWLGVEEL